MDTPIDTKEAELSPSQSAFSAFGNTAPKPQHKPLVHRSTYIDDIPKEMAEAKGWIAWRPSPHKTIPGKTLKRPIEAEWNKSQRTLAEVQDEYPGYPYGLAFNNQHDMIGIDVDGVDINDYKIQELLAVTPTIIEESPSGDPHRYHIYYKLEGDRAQIAPKISRIDQRIPVELYNTSTNYLTVTGVLRPESANALGTITVEQLHKLFPVTSPKHKKTPISIKSGQPIDLSDIGQTVDLETWIKMVPVHEDDPFVQAFMADKGYSHYEYWLIGCMAIKMRDGQFHHADSWSRKDESKYDESEMRVKWDSISSGQAAEEHTGAPVTVKTYQMYFNRTMIDWYKRTGKTGNGGPDPAEIKNYMQFLDRFGLEFVRDQITNEIILSGPPSIVYPDIYASADYLLEAKVNENTVGFGLMELTRRIRYMPTPKAIKEWNSLLINSQQKVGTSNIFRDAIEKIHWDGVDRIAFITDEVFEYYDMPLEELKLTKRMIRKFIYSMVRGLCVDELSVTHRNQGAEGILILQGEKAGIGKSSFGKLLWPAEWRRKLYVSTVPEFKNKSSMDQYRRATKGRLSVEWDESDQVFKGGSGNPELKALLTSETDVYHNLYENDEAESVRNYSIIASTNEMQLNLPSSGRRRFWPIRVTNIDIGLINEKFDQKQLLAQARFELIKLSKKNPKDKPPWNLNKTERDIHRDMIPTAVSQTNLAHMLLDIYDWSDEGFARRIEESKEANNDNLAKGKVLQTAMAISNEVNTLSGTLKAVSPAAVAKQVRQMLKECNAPDITFKVGTPIYNGYGNMGSRKIGYLMPALKQRATLEEPME